MSRQENFVHYSYNLSKIYQTCTYIVHIDYISMFT